MGLSSWIFLRFFLKVGRRRPMRNLIRNITIIQMVEFNGKFPRKVVEDIIDRKKEESQKEDMQKEDRVGDKIDTNNPPNRFVCNLKVEV